MPWVNSFISAVPAAVDASGFVDLSRAINVGLTSLDQRVRGTFHYFSFGRRAQ
jgi:hypothetical protein